MITPITYPARPKQGGDLLLAMEAGTYSGPGQVFLEPKYNGWRAMVHTPSGTMFNRHGEPLSIHREFDEALHNLKGLPFDWLDVEALERRHEIGQGTLVVLDWVVPGISYLNRRRMMAKFIKDSPTLGMEIAIESNDVWLITAWALSQPVVDHLWPRLQKINADLGCVFYEGVVSKRAESVYPIQFNSSTAEFDGWMKHRFTTR